MATAFGNFHDFCRDSTLPICNLFTESVNKLTDGQYGTGFAAPGDKNYCVLTGIPLKDGLYLRNLGSILLAFIAILITAFLMFRSERKRAAVGRREMQLFLLGYIIIEICEIFTVGGFPLSSRVRIGFTGVHIGMITATIWILLMNAFVGFQLLDDGTPLSLGLILTSSAAFLIGTGYIALDLGYSWTGYWDSSLTSPNRIYALYVLYQLAPLVFLFIYFVLETYVVIRVLGEKRPMLYLVAAMLLFAVGQIFNYVISIHICIGTSGKIDGALFETLFTLLSVVMIWVFWSSITEDDWPMAQTNGGFNTVA